MSSLVRFNFSGRRWFLRAPWQEPLYSERAGAGHRVLVRAFGWRVTVRRASDGATQ